LPNGEVGILVADVVGKGVGAALYMALNWTLIRTYAAEYPTQPELVCQAVNHRILRDTHADMFVTAFYGILNPASGTLIYSNAGQNPPHLYSGKSGNGVQRLSATGKPLGMFEDETWKKGVALLLPGDVLVLYTDGVVEAQDSQDAAFGEDRLLRSVQANMGRPAQDIQDAIVADVSEFIGGAPQYDDITLVVLARE
jgi:sigma-B regulation protein RsbU (phosphoserine phosphatase)